MARKATASVKTEINGYGSPPNATDESESIGLRGGAVGNYVVTWENEINCIDLMFGGTCSLFQPVFFSTFLILDGV